MVENFHIQGTCHGQAFNADDVRNTGSTRRSYDQHHFDEGLKDGG